MDECQSLTILDKVDALCPAHAWLEVGVTVAVDVGAARASDGKGLTHTHPSQGNGVYLGTRNCETNVALQRTLYTKKF